MSIKRIIYKLKRWLIIKIVLMKNINYSKGQNFSNIYLLFILPLIYFTITKVSNIINFVPDFVNIGRLKPNEYFGLILSSIASIFGILMAVILLTIEFSKERINKDRHVNSLDNQLVVNSIYFSVNLIALSFFAYISIDKFDESKSMTIGYYIGILFLIYIYSIFPVIKKIVGKSSQIRENIELANSINLDSFRTISKYRYDYNSQSSNDDISLKTLKKEIDRYILSNDITSYEKINNDILEKALGLIDNGSDREKCDIILDALTWLWKENSKTAIRANDSQYFDLMWVSIKEIYIYFAEKEINLLHLQELTFFLSLDLKNLYFKFNNTLSLTTALDCLEISFKISLSKNCPKQEDLRDLIRMYEKGKFEETEFYSSMQWDGINEILGYISFIREIAIKLSDKNLFEDCNRRIIRICTIFIFEFKNLGNYQKSYLIWNSLLSSFNDSNNALKHGLYATTLDCFDVPNYFIKRLIESKIAHEKDIRLIITTLGNYLIEAFNDNKLHTNYHYGTLKDFCLIGIHSVKNYHENSMDKKIVNYTLKFLKVLKKYDEERKLSKFSNEYNDIKKAIDHFVNVAKSLGGFKEDQRPLIKWVKLQLDFKENKEKKDFGFIKWKI